MTEINPAFASAESDPHLRSSVETFYLDDLPGTHYLVTSPDKRAIACVSVLHSTATHTTRVENRCEWVGEGELRTEGTGMAFEVFDSDGSKVYSDSSSLNAEAVRLQISPPERDPANLEMLVLYVGNRVLSSIRES